MDSFRILRLAAVLIWKLLSLCFVFSPVKCEFQLISDDSSPWQCYYSPVSGDCSTRGVIRNFPGTFQGQGSQPNVTVTYFEREALELGGQLDYYYPGIILELVPDYTVSDRPRRYQLILDKDRQTTCLIVIIPAYTSVVKVTQELYPMSGTTHYRIYVNPLPLLPSSGLHIGNDGDHNNVRNAVLDVVTGIFAEYRPGGRYPAPADWVAVIHYMVTGAGQNNASQSVEVVFSRPPDHYNFRRFQVALVGLPEEEHLEIQVDVTSKFWHIFSNVQPGHYRVSVKPLDDYFSVAGQCLCYDKNRLCTNCLTTETDFFVVD